LGSHLGRGISRIPKLAQHPHSASGAQKATKGRGEEKTKNKKRSHKTEGEPQKTRGVWGGGGQSKKKKTAIRAQWFQREGGWVGWMGRNRLIKGCKLRVYQCQSVEGERERSESNRSACIALGCTKLAKAPEPIAGGKAQAEGGSERACVSGPGGGYQSANRGVAGGFVMSNRGDPENKIFTKRRRSGERTKRRLY